MSSSFRSQLRSGPEAIQARLDSIGAGGNFTPVHQFEIGKIKYLQFLEPIEDIPEILMHQFMIVGYRENGSKIYERFISRKDPNIDGPDGYDEIMDRFGEPPKSRCITLAVEMKPVYGESSGKRKVIDHFEVAERQYENRDGETVTVPNVALVIESPFTLFGHLNTMADLGPIEETIFGIKQVDKRKNFTILQTNEPAVDVSEELADFLEEFDFDAWLEELADEDRMRALISPLADSWKITDYPAKDRGKDKSSGSTRSRRETEPEEEPNEEPKESEERTNRFQDLKRQARERAEKANA